jgi:hypothetical protein
MNHWAISVRQPFAWLIVAGHKDIENRPWDPKHRGPVLIHASARFYDGFTPSNALRNWPDITPPDEWLLGGIIGEAEIVEVVTHHRSRWFTGPHGLVLRNPRTLPYQMCYGRPGVFKVDYRPLKDE